jgi:hypothetical protein
MLMKYSYTKEQLIDAIAQSTSIRQVLSHLGLKEAGGNYSTIQRKIAEYGLDTAHFTGKGWNQGLLFRPNPPKTIEQLLVRGSTYQSHKLRKRLLKEGYFESKCYKCGISQWQGQPIPLELEHIDGDKSNNSLDNLTLLCPNCHALTHTWRRRKQRLRLR